MQILENNECNLKILAKVSPFIQNRYIKKSEIKGFIGRKEELSQIISVVKNIAVSEQSSAIKINGPGGSGKSTLFGYICQIIETEEIYENPNFKINRDDIEIISAFIDAPKGQKTDFRYIWTSIIDSLSNSIEENSGEFFEYFGTRLILKCLKELYLMLRNEEINNIIERIIPNFAIQIKSSNWEKIFNPNLVQNDLLLVDDKLISDIALIIKKYVRKLMRNQKILLNGKKTRFIYNEKYMNLIFQIFSEEITASAKALDKLKGIDHQYLKNDKEIIKLLNWVNLVWIWINKRPACFIIGVDNLGYLTVNLAKDESPYPSFIQTLLEMRNELNHFLFVLIGTTDDWEDFNDYVRDKKGYKEQLIGFIPKNINLKRLNRNEALDALRFRMQDFWYKCKLSPKNIYYPFSEKFFKYLFDFRLRDYREILNDLNDIWEEFHRNQKIESFSDSFTMIRFIRKKWVKTRILENFSPERMLPFEKFVLKEKWDNIISTFASNKRSKLVEKELTRFLNVLREKDRPRIISLVQNGPSIKIFKGNKAKTRYPDVYVQIMNSGTIDEKRCFEIQVKIHSDDQFVELAEINSSIDLLIHGKIDSLILLMTGPGLNPSVFEAIHKLNLSERIFLIDPLNKERMDALLFMVYYFELMNENPSPLIVNKVFNILFNQPWNNIIDKISKMSSLKLNSRLSDNKGVNIDLENLVNIAKKTKDSKDKDINTSELNQEEKKTNQSQKKQDDTNYSAKKEDNSNLSIIISRYQLNFQEIKLILKIALERKDRYKGRVTKDYVKKRVPPELQEEQCRLMFDQLKKDSKKDWPKIAKYEGTSLIISELGKKYYLAIR